MEYQGVRALGGVVWVTGNWKYLKSHLPISCVPPPLSFLLPPLSSPLIFPGPPLAFSLLYTHSAANTHRYSTMESDNQQNDAAILKAVDKKRRKAKQQAKQQAESQRLIDQGTSE